MTRDYGLSVLMLRPMAQTLGRVGADGDRFLAELGVDSSTSVDAYVSATKVDDCLDALALARADESFALSLAQVAVATQFGFFGHLVWLAPTLGDAISRAMRFYGLLTERASLELVTEGESATIRQHVQPDAKRGSVLIEFLFASLVLRARRASGGSFRAHAVRFVHTRDDVAPYESLFQAKLEFGAPKDEIALFTSDLALPLPTADATTAALLEERAIAMSQALAKADPFLDQVRQGILRGLRGQDQGLPSLARDLHLSERTLQRRLLEQGTSHRELQDDVRRTIAMHLLAHEAKSAVEVAYELGFSRPQAFHKAFVRWFGMTPGEFRQERGRSKS
jgi:AraC-like DNA-binding protein